MKFTGIVGIVLSVVSLRVLAADFFVRMTEGVTGSERASIQQAIQAHRVRSVTSLGTGIEVWRTSESRESIVQKLGADSRIVLHDNISSDFRNLFSEIGPTMDLDPEVARNLEVVRKKETTKEVRAVQIRSQPIVTRMLLNGFGETEGFAAPGTIRLNLFPNLNAVVTRQRVDVRGENNLQWSGMVTRTADMAVGERPSRALGEATLIMKNGNVMGRVTVGKETFTISPLGQGVHAVVRLDSTKFPPEHPPFQNLIERENRPYKPASETMDQEPRSLKNADGTFDDVTPTPVISVGVVYTKNAERLLVAQSHQDFSESLVGITNKSYRNSKVNAKLVLAGSTTIDYNESDWRTDRDALVKPNGGPLEAVHAWRKAIGANVIVMIVKLEGSCGVAGAILADAGSAYALVRQQCAWDNLSFPHEIGHLQGARHDHDPESNPFPYGHGYSRKGYWRTIMAYPGTCDCERQPYWANPNIIRDGAPMGTPQLNHDARVLSETADRISRLQP